MKLSTKKINSNLRKLIIKKTRNANIEGRSELHQVKQAETRRPDMLTFAKIRNREKQQYCK